MANINSSQILNRRISEKPITQILKEQGLKVLDSVPGLFCCDGILDRKKLNQDNLVPVIFLFKEFAHLAPSSPPTL